TSREASPEPTLLPRAIGHGQAHVAGAGMLRQQGAEGGGGTAACAPFVFRNDDHGFLAVAGHPLRLTRQGALDELGELGSRFVEGISLHGASDQDDVPYSLMLYK